MFLVQDRVARMHSLPNAQMRLVVVMIGWTAAADVPGQFAGTILASFLAFPSLCA